MDGFPTCNGSLSLVGFLASDGSLFRNGFLMTGGSLIHDGLLPLPGYFPHASHTFLISSGNAPLSRSGGTKLAMECAFSPMRSGLKM